MMDCRMYWLTRLVALKELKELLRLRNGDNWGAFYRFEPSELKSLEK